MPKVVLYAATMILITNSAFFLTAMLQGWVGYLVFFLLFSALGMVLFVPQKRAWQAAWIITFIGWFVSVIYWVLPEDFVHIDFEVKVLQTIITVVNLLSLFAIHRFIKFPYFDRRKRFFGKPAVRHSLMTAMTFPEHPHLVGSTMNLSLTGAKVSFDVASEVDLVVDEYVWFCFPEISSELLQGRVVAVEKPFVRFEFSPLTARYRQKMEEFLAKSSGLQKLPHLLQDNGPSQV